MLSTGFHLKFTMQIGKIYAHAQTTTKKDFGHSTEIVREHPFIVEPLVSLLHMKHMPLQ